MSVTTNRKQPRPKWFYEFWSNIVRTDLDKAIQMLDPDVYLVDEVIAHVNVKRDFETVYDDWTGRDIMLTGPAETMVKLVDHPPNAEYVEKRFEDREFVVRNPDLHMWAFTVNNPQYKKEAYVPFIFFRTLAESVPSVHYNFNNGRMEAEIIPRDFEPTDHWFLVKPSHCYYNRGMYP